MPPPPKKKPTVEYTKESTKIPLDHIHECIFCF